MFTGAFISRLLKLRINYPPRRMAVLELLLEGATMKSIATELNRHIKTIEYHLTQMCRDFCAYDSIHLMVRAHPAGKKRWVKHPKLTPQQNAVLRMRMKGIPLKTICRKLGITDATVRMHCRNIREKTQEYADRRTLRYAVAEVLRLTMEKSSSRLQKKFTRALAAKKTVWMGIGSRLTGNVQSAITRLLETEAAQNTQKLLRSLPIRTDMTDGHQDSCHSE